MKIALVASGVIILLLVVFSLWLVETVKEKDSEIISLKENLSSLQETLSSTKAELDRIKTLFNNLTKTKESTLRNPSWEELKTFLEADDTNKLVYDEKSFDCTGFAIELFKRARVNGFRVGIVELVFEDNRSAHLLNVFQTTDRGTVFIDVTGNENGTGKDKVGYVEVGKPYGSIDLENVKERFVDCSISCSELSRTLSYSYYSNIFSYSYFSSIENCLELYNECVDAYNKAVEEFNKGYGSYTYSQLNTWYENLETLRNYLVSGDFYIISKITSPVKNVQILW